MIPLFSTKFEFKFYKNTSIFKVDNEQCRLSASTLLAAISMCRQFVLDNFNSMQLKMVKVSIQCLGTISDGFDVSFTKNLVWRMKHGTQRSRSEEGERVKSGNDEGSIKAKCRRLLKNMDLITFLYSLCVLNECINKRISLVDQFGTVLMILSNAHPNFSVCYMWNLVYQFD